MARQAAEMRAHDTIMQRMDEQLDAAIMHGVKRRFRAEILTSMQPNHNGDMVRVNIRADGRRMLVDHMNFILAFEMGYKAAKAAAEGEQVDGR